MDIKQYEVRIPAKSQLITLVQVVERTGVHPSRLGELIELSWIEPQRTSGDEYLFRLSDVYRIRKFLRLCDDFGLSDLAGTIIVDLLDRIEDLQRKVHELEQIKGV